MRGNTIMLARACCALVLFLGATAQAQTFHVNSAGDQNDPTDNQITLREALALANASEGHDTIQLPERMQIRTSLGYSVTDDVTIQGIEGSEAEIHSSADTLFDLSGEISVGFQHLVLAGDGGVRAVQICGTVKAERLVVTGFVYAFNLCEDPVDLHITQTSFIDNNLFLAGWGPDQGNVAKVLVESSYLGNSGMFVRSYDADVSIEIQRTLYIGKEAFLRINGSTSLLIKDSALLLSDSGPLLTATYDSRRPAGSSMSEYFYPRLEVIQSTIAGNQSNSPLITTEGADVRIAHATLADNANFDGHLIELKGYKEFYSGDIHGSAEIDHTIIDRYFSQDTPILLSRADLQASYSFIPPIAKRFGTESYSLDATTSQYQGAPAYLGPLVSGQENLPYYLPQPGSPVVDAGNASAVAGENGIPEKEQRLSERVLGGVIDIGATEFNREPVLDHAAMRAEYDAQVATLQAAKTDSAQNADEDLVVVIEPDDIVLDLDNFVSDPDGHAIQYILFFSDEDLVFSPGSNAVHGEESAFKGDVMTILIFDETGLMAHEEVDWRSSVANDTDRKSSGGGGGMPAIMLAAIATLGVWRRRRRSCPIPANR